jgi:hypothetical protein
VPLAKSLPDVFCLSHADRATPLVGGGPLQILAREAGIQNKQLASLLERRSRLRVPSQTQFERGVSLSTRTSVQLVRRWIVQKREGGGLEDVGEQALIRAMSGVL